VLRLKRRRLRFTPSGAQLHAVMTFLDDAAIREEIWRGMSPGRVRQVRQSGEPQAYLAASQEKAALRDFRDFADFVLADRMPRPGSCQGFSCSLSSKTDSHFARENQELRAFPARLDGRENLNPWDVATTQRSNGKLCTTSMRKLLRPYFPLEKSGGRLFEIAKRLFGVQF